MEPNTAQHARRKKRGLLSLLIILLLILLIIAAVVLWRGGADKPAEEEGPEFAANASVGALPGKSEEEIKAMLNQKITEKTVAYTINAVPVFENGSAEGNLMLESPANNINYIEFVIRRDDTGEEIYRSGLLKPNQYITEDKLAVVLPQGSYLCTADITLYDPETLESKGMTQAAITITVKN